MKEIGIIVDHIGVGKSALVEHLANKLGDDIILLDNSKPKSGMTIDEIMRRDRDKVFLTQKSNIIHRQKLMKQELNMF